MNRIGLVLIAGMENHMRAAVLCAMFVSACGSSPAAPLPGTTVPDVPTTAARFFGVVTNEEGAPLAGATVGVTYVADSGSTQGGNTQTASDGRYELQLNARQPGNVNALIRASASGDYLPTEQLVRVTAATERNLRLRRVRTIGVGQSTTITIDADSSRCTMPRTDGVCEWVRIQFPSTWVYRLVVKVTAEGSGVVPTLLTNYGFPPIGGAGAISIPIGEDDFWDPRVPRFLDVAVFVPHAETPQQYEVILYAAP
jgi:hypothetical protein